MHSRISTAVLLVGGALAFAAPATAQSANPTQERVSEGRGQVPVYRVTVVARSTPAINYRHRSGSTTIDFAGTPLLPDARGEAKVESKQGYIEVEVEFDDLKPATRFGPEYLTYVMWAITPEGRATNLGEVLLNGTKSKLNVTTELQAFGLVITAEPYFAVTQPSDVVVMENAIRPETRGKIEQVDAKYELLKRGTYLMNVEPGRFTAQHLDEDTPLELHEARNAIQLSKIAGADRYAIDSYQKAERLLDQAEETHAKDRGTRATIQTAREAAQTAEDARLISLQRQDEEALAQERQASADREADANRRTRDEERRRQDAEADRLASDQRRQQAEQSARQAELAAQQAARERADADTARAAAERARAEADLASQRLAGEREAAEAARLAADARAQQAQQLADRAEQEKTELRARLQRQLNIILDTRESARGLIVNMSDVLFDTARATLRPGAREKLAKVAGIVLAYPDLKLSVEGHTDSVGGDTYNQDLSERRAASVRDYLVQQGIGRDAIIAAGFGESQPVVSNDTAAGRQQNRRVELVVSGESIGKTPPTSDQSLDQPEGAPVVRRVPQR